MKTLEKGIIMEMNSDIAMSKAIEALTKISNPIEARRKAAIGVTLIGYMDGDLTKMEAAKILQLSYEDMNKLLLKYNMPTIMNLPEDLEKIGDENMEKVAKRFNVKLK